MMARHIAISGALVLGCCAWAACTKADPVQSTGAARTTEVAAQSPENGAATGSPGDTAAQPAPEVTLSPLPPPRPLAELRCGELPMRLAGEPAPLLAGRLHVQPLAGARDEARSHGIMSAPAAVEQETRLFLEHQGQKLVIMAYELLQLAGELPAGQAVAAVQPAVPAPDARLAAHAFTTADERVRAIAVTPESLDVSHGEAVFALGVVTAHPDGTAQVLAFYVDPAAGASGRDCTDAALHVARTLRAGERGLERGAGERALPGWGGLRIDVARDWVLTTQEGPDFFVHRLQQLVPLGQVPPRLGIYLGHHPSRHEWAGDEKTPGRLLGQDVVWEGATSAGGAHQRQALADLPGEPGARVHVWLSAPDQASLAAAQSMAASLRQGARP